MYDIAARACAMRSGIYVCSERVHRHDVGFVEEHGVRTATNLQRGDFVGLYPGNWAEGMCMTKSDYSFDVDGEFTVVPPPRKGGSASVVAVASQMLDGTHSRASSRATSPSRASPSRARTRQVTSSRPHPPSCSARSSRR